jgi:protein SCO1/2
MRVIFRLTLLLLLLGLVSCQPKQPIKLDLKGTDLSGSGLGGDFTLTDHLGATRTLADFRGKVVAIFFGYTHCPDVCPTTLLEYSHVAKELGADADKMQVIFVSVDPQRDTTQVLAGYVPYFGSRFVGMSGNPAQLAAVMAAYKVVAKKVPQPGGSYSVDHSAGSYLLDREGQARVYEAYGTSSAALAHDIRQLLR